MLIDTLKAAQNLQSSGLPKQQAEAIAHAIADIENSGLATKADIGILRGELKTEIAELRGELKAEIAELRGEIGTLRGEIGTLRGDMGTLRGEVNALRNEISTLRWILGVVIAMQAAIFIKLFLR
jgi:chromosome segregation ATPase